MTNFNNERLKFIVIDFLQGTHLDEITVRLQIECNKTKTACKSLYQSISLKPNNTDKELTIEEESDSIPAQGVKTNDEPVELLAAILGSLNIQKSSSSNTFSQYENLLAQSNNLHELLLLLYHDGSDHLGVLLELIETTKPKTRWTMVLLGSTIITAGIGGLAYFKKESLQAAIQWLSTTFPSIMHWLGRTFGLLRNIPLLGISYNSLDLIWSWHHTFSSGTTTPTHKLHELFFKTLTASLTLSAYVVSFLAAGSMTLVATIFFVLSSSTKVFQSIFNWWKSSESLQTLTEPQNGDGWEIYAEYERAKNFHNRLLTSVWTNLAAATATTIGVGLWSLFPPSLFLSIFCITFISLTALTEHSYLTHIRDISAADLQKDILNIKTPRPKYLRPDNQEDATKATLLYQEMRAREEVIDKRAQEVQEEQAEIAEVKELLHDIHKKAARWPRLFEKKPMDPHPPEMRSSHLSHTSNAT